MNTDDPLLSFGQRLQAFSETVPLERTVIDVRDNGGGNNFLPRVWVDRLSRSETINREGRLTAAPGAATKRCGRLRLRRNCHPSGNVFEAVR